MIRANIIIRIEDGDNVYKIGDRVRVKLNSDSEFIGIIDDIMTDRIYLSDDDFVRGIYLDNIKAIRLAEDGETFYNTWNF